MKILSRILFISLLSGNIFSNNETITTTNAEELTEIKQQPDFLTAEEYNELVSNLSEEEKEQWQAGLNSLSQVLGYWQEAEAFKSWKGLLTDKGINMDLVINLVLAKK